MAVSDWSGLWLFGLVVCYLLWLCLVVVDIVLRVVVSGSFGWMVVSCGYGLIVLMILILLCFSFIISGNLLLMLGFVSVVFLVIVLLMVVGVLMLLSVV